MEKAKVTFRIPKYIEDADEDFFTNAFQQKGIIQHNVKVKVINYVPEKKGPGMCCDIGFYELEYTSYNSKAPRLVCAKFTPRLPKPNWEAAMKNEIINYLTIPSSAIRRPKCYFAAFDTTTKAYCLILQDLRPNLTIGTRMLDLPVDRAKIAVVSIAKLHATYWGGTTAYYGPHTKEFKATINMHSLKRYFKFTFTTNCFMHSMLDLQKVLPLDVVEGTENWPKLVTSKFNSISNAIFGPMNLKKRDEKTYPMCLIHGDLNPDNIFLIEDKDAGCFIDFSSMAITHPFFDISYFLITSMKTSDLIENKDILLEIYHNALIDYGAEQSGFLVPPISELIEKIWMDFLIIPLLFLSSLGPLLLNDQRKGTGYAAKHPSMEAKQHYNVVTRQFKRTKTILKHYDYESWIQKYPGNANNCLSYFCPCIC